MDTLLLLIVATISGCFATLLILAIVVRLIIGDDQYNTTPEKKGGPK